MGRSLRTPSKFLNTQNVEAHSLKLKKELPTPNVDWKDTRPEQHILKKGSLQQCLWMCLHWPSMCPTTFPRIPCNTWQAEIPLQSSPCEKFPKAGKRLLSPVLESQPYGPSEASLGATLVMLYLLTAAFWSDTDSPRGAESKRKLT